MPANLTDAAIAIAMKGAEGLTRRELLDAHEAGLRLRIGDKSAIWSVATRGPGGHRMRISLGGWPQLDVAAARGYAKAVKASLKPAPPEIPGVMTVRRLLEIYGQRRLVQLRKGRVIRRSLDAALSTVADVEPNTLTRRQIAEIVDLIAERAPIHANRSLAYLRAFFSWSRGRGYIERNPAEGVSKPSREVPRDRTPSLGEVVEIWRAAGLLGYPFGHAIRLLILTASRRDEVGGIMISELELPREQLSGVWTIPAARSKNGRAIRVPLAPLARRTIEDALAARKGCSDFIFSTVGERPVSGWSRAKRRLDAAILKARRAAKLTATMAPWRIHDLRRAFATQACDLLHIDPVTADRCLNHVGASTTSTIGRVYGRSEMFDQRRDALERWAELVEGAVTANATNDGEAGSGLGLQDADE